MGSSSSHGSYCHGPWAEEGSLDNICHEAEEYWTCETRLMEPSELCVGTLGEEHGQGKACGALHFV